MEPKPLVWTPWAESLWRRDGFLADFPWFGPRARVRRFFAKQLRQRDASVLRLWRDVPRGVEYLPFIAYVLYEYLRWPCVYYIPEDRCDILFMPDPGPEMLLETALLVLRDELEFTGDALDHLQDITLRERVIAIRDRPAGRCARAISSCAASTSHMSTTSSQATIYSDAKAASG